MSFNAVPPSEERSAEFWRGFANGVEKKLESVSGSRPSWWSGLWDDLVSFVMMRPVYVSAVSSGAMVAVVVFFVWQSYYRTLSQENSAQPTITEIPAQQISTNARMSDYFRKSKTLLVGITNMKLEGNEPVDLQTERKFSRELLHEARYLKSQPISGRSAKLINNLEKILIELANLKDEGGAPNVEIIRGGIHQENLLFKIRVAESVYDTSHVIHNNEIY